MPLHCALAAHATKAPARLACLDLACRIARLAVELDGSQHGAPIAYDQQRTALLEREGWLVLRFWTDDVMENIEGVADAIIAAVGAWVETHP